MPFSTQQAPHFHRPTHPLWVMISKIGLVVAVALLAYFSLIPSDSIGISASDKIMHFVAYGLIAGAAAAAFPKTKLLRVFLFAAGLGALLEGAQHIAGTGRTASIVDQIANMGGAALAIVVWTAFAALKARFTPQ